MESRSIFKVAKSCSLALLQPHKGLEEDNIL